MKSNFSKTNLKIYKDQRIRIGLVLIFIFLLFLVGMIINLIKFQNLLPLKEEKSQKSTLGIWTKAN